MRAGATIRMAIAAAFAFGAPIAFAQSGQPTNAATKAFTDAQRGVSFRYPADWTLTTEQHFYIPESILTLPKPDSDDRATARAAVFREGKDWPGLANSTLNGADFVYNAVPGASLQACTNWLHRRVDFNKTDEQTRNGIPFMHVRTGSGGLCHGADESIYIHQGQGACYFFDLAVHTICPGVVEGERNATPEQLAAVRARLRRILDTVRISAP
jgi:hypothetical protein